MFSKLINALNNNKESNRSMHSENNRPSYDRGLTFFDVETANARRSSICAIGIVRYENGRIVHEKEYLINPETYFSKRNTEIHGLAAEDVENAPTFPELWPLIKSYFSNTTLIAHNAKSMDINALYRTLLRYNIPMVNNRYICTLELAKCTLGSEYYIDSYSLDSLCRALHIELNHHHNSLSDAIACCQLYWCIKEAYPRACVPKEYELPASAYNEVYHTFTSANYSNETKSMRELEKLINGIIEDNQIDDNEMLILRDWVDEHSNLLGFYPFDKIYNLIEDVMADGVLDENEEKSLLSLLDSFINPKFSDTIVDFVGKKVCLSGDFSMGEYDEVVNFVISLGADVCKTVSGKTDILILGDLGSPAWKYGNYGTKYEKACQLNESGKNIQIYKENLVFRSRL